MAGTLKVGTITTPTGSGSITIPSGVAMTGHMYPAFEVYLSANQTVTSGSTTKVDFDTEVYDTDNAFDTSNNRFTVPTGKAGKYFFYSPVYFGSSSETIEITNVHIYKNGSSYSRIQTRSGTNEFNARTVTVSMCLDLVADDYIEIFAYLQVSSGTPQLLGDNATHGLQTTFGGYRIGD